MLGNWSGILNVLLLVGVIIAIVGMVKSRRKNLHLNDTPPTPLVGSSDNTPCDDIIAVRKVTRDIPVEAPTVSSPRQPATIVEPVASSNQPVKLDKDLPSIMMVLQAKGDRHLAGYELLQTLLSAGLRFGEGHLFHRHQHFTGQGPVLCSVAAATLSGMFDLQNIGAFSVRGLCIFMQASGNPTIDAERFSIMLDTAKQLSDDLDTYLLNDERQPLTDETLARYYRLLNIDESCDLELV